MIEAMADLIGTALHSPTAMSLLKVFAYMFIFAGVVHVVLCFGFGLSVGHINPFMLKAHNIGIRNKRFTLKIKSVQLQLSLLDLTNVQLLVSGVHLVIDKIPQAQHARVPRRVPTMEDLRNLDPDKPVCIFSNHARLRWLVKFYLFYFRFIGVKFFDLNLRTVDKRWNFHVEAFFAKLDMNNDKRDNVKITARIVQLQVTSLEVLDSCALEVTGSLNTGTGQLCGLKVNIGTRVISVRMLSFIRRIKHSPLHSKAEPSLPAEELDETSRMFIDVYKRFSRFCLSVRLFESLDISFQSINIRDIPLASFGVIACPKYEPLALIHLSIKSVAFSMERTFADSPGYGLLYDHADRPYRLAFNITGVTLQMEHVGKFPPKEIIAIPSMNVTGTSNVAYRTLEATISRKVSKGKTILSGHLSEPIIDMSTQEISLAFQSALNFLTYLRCGGSDVSAKQGTSSSQTTLWLFKKKMSKLWPTLELKFGIENPVLMTKSTFDENYLRILMIKLSVLSIEFKTTRETVDGQPAYLSYHNGEIQNLVVGYRDTKSMLDENVMNIGQVSLKQLLQIVPHKVLTSSLDIDAPKIDLSNLTVLNGINYIFAELDEKIIPQLRSYLRNVNIQANGQEQPCPAMPIQEDTIPFDDKTALEIIHDKIPDWLESVTYSLANTTILVGSRSLLLNKELIKSLDPQATNDLVNGGLRKIQLSIESVIVHFSTGIEILGDGESSLASALEDDDRGLIDSTSESSAGSDKWSFKIETSKLLGKLISETSHKKQVLHSKVFLKVAESTISFKPCPQGENALFLSLRCPKVEAFYSIMTHFIIISGFHLVRNTVFEFMHKNPIGEPRKHQTSNSYAKKIIDQIHFSADLVAIDIIMILPDRMKTRIQFSEVGLSGTVDSPILANSTCTRLCTESPTAPGYWTRLVTAVNGSTSINLPVILSKGEGPWIEFANDSCHVTFPHQFITYKLFDNISVSVKTLKQLHYSLKNNSDKIVIYPVAETAKKIPPMKLKSNHLLFSMDDDPFECELNMILQIGLLEQKMRVEKIEAFETRLAESIQQKKKPTTPNGLNGANVPHSTKSADETLNHLKALPKRIHKAAHGHHAKSISTFPETAQKAPILPDPAESLRQREIVRDALARLHEGFSKSWIARVKTYRSKLEINFEKSFKYVWGSLDTSTLPHGFDSRVLDFVKDPSLFNLSLEGVDLKVEQPHFGIENVSKFLHDVGKGVPLDSEYSTLIPVNINLRLTELRCHLRDYPLPFIHMPRLTKGQDSDRDALGIHGDLVIAEFNIQSHEEVREVFVPLVPGCGEFDEDNCYSIEVPKTLTAIKFYTSLDWELNSTAATQVTWCTSYQPCIQQMMLNLDNFTKAPIDPSEKVGFWDKVRANFHARIFFKFHRDGQLNIAFKGSKDPYAIGGESTGFVLGFKNDLTLTINENDDPKDFACAKANQIFFATPNHFAHPLLIWSKSTDDAILLSDTSTNFQKSTFGYFLNDYGPANPTFRSAMAEEYIDKNVITLSGGVSLTLGFAFERKIEGTLNRTFESSSHYGVVLRNPKYVKNRDKYDAYKGFRSQFIHMALTLVSLKKDAYNTIQLSPSAFQYFFAWWRMFSNTLSVRHGKVFGPETPSKKFSAHLFTIKYQAILEPLFVTHVYQDLDHRGGQGDVDCVGIKGRTSRFVLDLHQRKELTFEHNEKLGITRKSMKMKFNTGKVDLKDFDVRAIEALFVKNYQNPESTSEPEPEVTFSSFDGDHSWLDISDFKEIGVSRSDNASGSVVTSPMMYTPRFLYFKRNGYGDKYQIDSENGKLIPPFGSEKFHDCEIETNPSPETQHRLVIERILELELKLEDNSKRIAAFKAATATPAELRAWQQLKLDNDQLRHGIKFIKEIHKHHCVMDPGTAESISEFPSQDDNEESFINCFIVHNMMLKWNDQNRNVIFRYIYMSEMRDSVSHFSQHKSLAHLDEAIVSQRKSNYEGVIEHPITRSSTYESKAGSKLDESSTFNDSRATPHIENFKQELRSLARSFDYRIHENYLVKLISPQIQLHSSEDESSVVLVVAPNIGIESIAFDASQDDEGNDEHIFQKRVGAILRDASMFLFHEEEFVSTGKLFFNSSSYGSQTNWPPWLGLELCYDGSFIPDHVLMEKTTIMVQYDKPTSFFMGSESEDIIRLSCDLSQVVLKCDSQQYYSLYTIITQLLIYTDPRSLKLKQDESKMLLSVNTDDIAGIKARVMLLQKSLQKLQEIIDNYSSRASILDDLELSDLTFLKNGLIEVAAELYFMMKVSSVGTRKSTEEADDYLEWDIRADDIKLHMLDDSRHPFLDVILFDAHFKRCQRSDHSDRNTISIGNFEVINLDRDSSLPIVFSGFETKEARKERKKKKVIREAEIEPLIFLSWHMDYPVGGIRLMRKFDVAIQPIQLSIEEITGRKIIKYIFPDDNIDDRSSQTDDLNSLKSITSNQTGLPGHIPKSSKSPLAREAFNAHTKIINHRAAAGGLSEHSTPRSSFAHGRDGNNIDNYTMIDNSAESDDEDDEKLLDDMVERAAKYLSFNSFRLRSAVICVTFRGKGSLKLVNVSNFVITLPEISLANKTMTLLDLSMHIKKAIVKTLLSHTGSILGNKLSSNNGKPKTIISKYASERISTFRDDRHHY